MDELLRTKLQKIRCIVTDVDGCLTRGDIYLGPDGQEMKVFCAKDAPRIASALAAGIKIVFFTGRKSSALEARAKELGVAWVLYKEDLREKGLSLYDWVARYHDLEPKEVLYFGDDWNDLPFMANAGVAACPTGAAEANWRLVTGRREKDQSGFWTVARGGEGAVSEVIECILRAKGLWQAAIDRHYKGLATIQN